MSSVPRPRRGKIKKIIMYEKSVSGVVVPCA
jgi:hypothetical protein